MEHYYYQYFRKSCPHDKKLGRSIELIISPKCNLGCKYCYVHRFRKKIFDDDCFNEERTIENLKTFCEWLRVNEFNCDIEIFSGELFGQEIGYKVLNILIDYYASVEPDMRCRTIIIPTNFTFLCSEEATARVEEIRAKLKDLGIALILSASFDGKYMEQNRPYIGDMDVPLGGLRDDEYYNRCFDYCKKTDTGFHPMVYSKGIELWPKNFDWFQEKFKEFDLPWPGLYLLQVRNVEWTAKQIEDMRYFIEYLYKFAYEKFNGDRNQVTHWVIVDKGFNILSQPYSRTGRGLTCGIQSQMMFRVSDMKSYPCHRLGYKDFYFGEFVPDKDKVLRFKSQNVELQNMILPIHKENLPYCAQCPINHLCTGTCLGSQYESTNNILAPIPSVCALTYAMVIANLQCMRKYGNMGLVYRYMNHSKLDQILALERKISQ